MSARETFIHEVLRYQGATVLWGGLDCSELVALGIKAAGGPDMRLTHRAQNLHDETTHIATQVEPIGMLPGDLVFYGTDAAHIIHVAIWLADNRVLSADGATPRIKTLEAAKKAGAMVRVHASVRYRLDCPFIALHSNTYLDRLDGVSR